MAGAVDVAVRRSKGPSARVCWPARPEPWVAESELIAQLGLPLNLDQNRKHAFHQHLSTLRASVRARTREFAMTCSVALNPAFRSSWAHAISWWDDSAGRSVGRGAIKGRELENVVTRLRGSDYTELD
ncbi:GIY-YIG nuclease family protein [Nonomuraea basaltis]|uniref:GIY-YIG nuclease family protein n=1 Tax=Nonomuraea basaltis TaxID=2495887 RepID=UPI003B846BDD